MCTPTWRQSIVIVCALHTLLRSFPFHYVSSLSTSINQLTWMWILWCTKMVTIDRFRSKTLSNVHENCQQQIISYNCIEVKGLIDVKSRTTRE